MAATTAPIKLAQSLSVGVAWPARPWMSQSSCCARHVRDWSHTHVGLGSATRHHQAGTLMMHNKLIEPSTAKVCCSSPSQTIAARTSG
jgi:hypothetical protein